MNSQAGSLDRRKIKMNDNSIRFRIRPEYIKRFGSVATIETELDMYDLEDFAFNWVISLDKVLEMVYVCYEK